MQCTRIITTNISPTLARKRPHKLRPMGIKTDNPKVATPNPPPDSDQLAYRLCELSLQKMQKEAIASEPDLRHVLASSSMQKMARQDLLHRLDAQQRRVPLYSIPLLPGADEPLLSENGIWDMSELEIAILELEKARRRSDIARIICFQHASEMWWFHGVRIYVSGVKGSMVKGPTGLVYMKSATICFYSHILISYI